MVQFITWTYKHIKLRSPNSANSVVCVCCSITSPTYCERMSKTQLSFFSPLRIWTHLTKHNLQPRLVENAPRHLSSRPAKSQYRATQNVKESLTLYKSQVFQYAEIYANRNKRKRTFSSALHGKSTHLPKAQESNRVKRMIIPPAL
jgi:hypothetical protein